MAISCGFKEVMAFIASVSMRPTLMKQQQYKTCTRRLIQRNKTYIKLLLLKLDGNRRLTALTPAECFCHRFSATMVTGKFGNRRL